MPKLGILLWYLRTQVATLLMRKFGCRKKLTDIVDDEGYIRTSGGKIDGLSNKTTIRG